MNCKHVYISEGVVVKGQTRCCTVGSRREFVTAAWKRNNCSITRRQAVTSGRLQSNEHLTGAIWTYVYCWGNQLISKINKTNTLKRCLTVLVSRIFSMNIFQKKHLRLALKFTDWKVHLRSSTLSAWVGMVDASSPTATWQGIQLCSFTCRCRKFEKSLHQPRCIQDPKVG